MDAAIPNQGLMWRVRNFVFLTGVLLMFYTLPKPAPVDVAFVAAMALSPFVNQTVNRNFTLLILLLGAWCISFHIASVHVWRDEEVPFELFQKTYAVLLGIGSCFAAMSWHRQQFITFLKVYVVSCVIAATLGIIGFATGIEILTSWGRAKGLINDPNMYSAFLVPGVLASLYLMPKSQRPLLWMGVAGFLTVGVMLSFSRVGIVGAVLCSGLYIFYVNRKKPARLVKIGFAALVGFGLVVILLFALGGDEFTKLLEERATIAKSYDLGREGRYARYERAIPIIMDNPLGLGARQERWIFVEPIHNIWIGSFLLYGWVAGFAWIAFFAYSVMITIRNQRLTSDPMPTLLFLCFLSTILGATLHEGEHWRPLWLFTGMVWGLSVRREAEPAAEPSYAPDALPAPRA